MPETEPQRKQSIAAEVYEHLLRQEHIRESPLRSYRALRWYLSSSGMDEKEIEAIHGTEAEAERREREWIKRTDEERKAAEEQARVGGINIGADGRITPLRPRSPAI